MQSPQSIRLIRLHPSSKQSAPLDLNLLEVSLEIFRLKYTDTKRSHTFGELPQGLFLVCVMASNF
jgi:hypothetical protein